MIQSLVRVRPRADRTGQVSTTRSSRRRASTPKSKRIVARICFAFRLCYGICSSDFARPPSRCGEVCRHGAHTAAKVLIQGHYSIQH